MSVVKGWVGAYTSNYSESPFTESRKQALVDIIRKRHYFYTYHDLCYLDNCCPLYSNNTISIPTKAEWDEVLATVYAEMPCTQRLIPLDAIKRKVKNGILYERKEDENDNQT